MAHPGLIEERLTIEDIDALEERTQVRHELVGGIAYAMVGASVDHARIVRNLCASSPGPLLHSVCVERGAPQLLILILLLILIWSGDYD